MLIEFQFHKPNCVQRVWLPLSYIVREIRYLPVHSPSAVTHRDNGAYRSAPPLEELLHKGACPEGTNHLSQICGCSVDTPYPHLCCPILSLCPNEAVTAAVPRCSVVDSRPHTCSHNIMFSKCSRYCVCHHGIGWSVFLGDVKAPGLVAHLDS